MCRDCTYSILYRYSILVQNTLQYFSFQKIFAFIIISHIKYVGTKIAKMYTLHFKTLMDKLHKIENTIV